eukprot:3356870-Pyramimonas_sp.AAC.1
MLLDVVSPPTVDPRADILPGQLACGAGWYYGTKWRGDAWKQGADVPGPGALTPLLSAGGGGALAPGWGGHSACAVRRP